MNRNLGHKEQQMRRTAIENQLNENCFRKVLADEVKAIMKTDDWSGRALASVVGVEEVTIRRILLQKQNISIDILLKLCLSLKIKLSDIALKANM